MTHLVFILVHHNSATPVHPTW
ncbi:hypothetical protein A2U01_0119444, partial [Trifolium medium]|nr:hypothetical protein [Trifolium medium]